MANTPEYNLPQNAYANFDALSLKSFMINQLNASGKFTDQNYEGSNIASLLDILAYYTHVLLFQLNQTSNETMFSQSTIYENMNRIVKQIGYNPTGKQTSLVPINCVASSSLPSGNYLIRKYSYMLIDNIQYTFISDCPFEKLTSNVEPITSISQNAILYQGTVGEYPQYTAFGAEYESFPIVVDNLVSTTDTRFISHGTISVYVFESESSKWVEYSEVDSLFLTTPTARAYELRLNENGHYEVKFGNNIFGRKLGNGDFVSVFYILSDGESGIISKNVINGNKLFIYNSVLFNEIYPQTTKALNSTQITDVNKLNLTFNNPADSTLIQEAETVDQIRENSPVFMSRPLRLITDVEYEIFLKKSIPNVLNSVKVVNNKKYISEYIDYFYKICVDPNKVNRVILNQVNYADSCDFNNVNVFCVPTLNLISDEMYPDFISNSFKNLILKLTDDKKMMGVEVVPRDPIYVALDFGFTNNTPHKSIYSDTSLVIIRDKNNKINPDSLKYKVGTTILNYFSANNVTLGQTIDMSALTSSILSIPGVSSLKTVNSSEGISFNGLSFICWNPVFDGVDETIINQNVTLPFFKFPYIYRPNTLANRIQIID